jgi:ribosomal-protein-alanine N-acetyltransferase|tara:strand:- start:411 stop:830 length:420 start_codon:yes stop_codon:yes gene_type:complete
MDHSDLKEAYEIEKQTNPSPWSKENFFSSYEVGHKSLVCRIDNIIVGFIIFSVIKKEIHLLNIAVHTRHQKKGIGSLLMETMLKQASVMGVSKVYLEVRSKNEKAILFYKKYNFIKDAVRVNYYTGKNSDDAVLMSLAI